jgi:Bacterial mobilisation protein (MobC)
MQRWNMVVPIDTARVIDTNATLMGLNRTQYLIARGEKRVYMRREPTPPVEVIALLKILAELKRQGNNLNQIARRLNSGDSIDDVKIHLESTTKKITSLLNGWLD